MSGFRFFPANSSPRNKERERAREETSFGCKDLDATKLPSAVATLSIFFSFSFLYSYILFCFTPLFYFFKVTSSSNAIFLVSKFRNLRCNKWSQFIRREYSNILSVGMKRGSLLRASGPSFSVIHSRCNYIGNINK